MTSVTSGTVLRKKLSRARHSERTGAAVHLEVDYHCVYHNRLSQTYSTLNGGC